MTLTSYAIDGLGEGELPLLLEGRSAWDNSMYLAWAAQQGQPRGHSSEWESSPWLAQEEDRWADLLGYRPGL